jgi:predicted nucleic acid-binding protein
LRIALDSNVMIYAEGVADDPRVAIAKNLVELLPDNHITIPCQCVAETLNWMVRKGRVEKPVAALRASRWTMRYSSQPTTTQVLLEAFELLTMHDLQVFDAIILAAADEAGADFLLSEDMQDGFSWRGVTVVNPFAEPRTALVKYIFNLED